jgi:uncharacterized membrane protein YuzA (DUF378 family)|tara:strand:+ start:434 stop:727 length:294 start_codon:yes stop_codon:yes gene_type:complete
MLKSNSKVHMVTFLLLVLGGLQAGVIGLFEMETGFLGLLGPTPMKIVLVLIGLSAIYELITHKGSCKNCSAKGSSSPSSPSQDSNSGQMNLDGGGGQ